MTFDFLRYAKDNGIPHRTRYKNLSKNWLCAINCPICGNDDGFHMGIPMDGSYSYCWRHGSSSLIAVTSALTPSIPFVKLKEEYGGEESVVDRLNVRKHVETLDYDFPSMLESKAAVKYLTKRGFDAEYLAEKYHLGWGGVTGKWAYRIILPLFHEGVVVSWQGRIIQNVPDVPRYITLGVEESKVDPKSVLFNQDNCIEDSVLFVEGPMDVMKFGDGALCSFGTTVTESQIQSLVRYQKVVLCFDNEESAQAKARKVAQKLSACGVKTVMNVNLDMGDKDVGDLTQDEIKELRQGVGL